MRESIDLTDDEVQGWEDLRRKMYLPFNGDGILSQFEGYDTLEELDWDAYRTKYGNIQRLDRILRAEGDTPDRYKLAKQADTLMLFFLFSEDELRQIFEDLGYEYTPDTAAKTIDYYAARTTHGSTLSFVVHAYVLSRLDPQRSWDMFLTALESDVSDVQGGTTPEGIHMGVMAGTLDLLQRGYLGTESSGDLLRFAPKEIERLSGLSMLIRFRDCVLKLALAGDSLTVLRVDDSPSSIQIGVGDTVRHVHAGQRHEFPLAVDSAADPSA